MADEVETGVSLVGRERNGQRTTRGLLPSGSQLQKLYGAVAMPAGDDDELSGDDGTEDEDEHGDDGTGMRDFREQQHVKGEADLEEHHVFLE